MKHRLPEPKAKTLTSGDRPQPGPEQSELPIEAKQPSSDSPSPGHDTPLHSLPGHPAPTPEQAPPAPPTSNANVIDPLESPEAIEARAHGPLAFHPENTPTPAHVEPTPPPAPLPDVVDPLESPEAIEARAHGPLAFHPENTPTSTHPETAPEPVAPPVVPSWATESAPAPESVPAASASSWSTESTSEPARATPPPLPFKSPPSPTEHETSAQPVAHSDFLIQTQGLVKQYGGRRVVNGVDIHVRPGEVVGLLGKNGAGKTTTFYMIVGLVPPTQGHVFMGDEDVTHMPMYRRARRGIGYLPQEESIFRKLTVEDNLLAILETLPISEEEREARCDELLKDFGLEHVRENVSITLSGGEKRRVTIARALVTSPTLLLLDEPFSGVDPMAVHDIQEIILQLKQRGLGVLITDHNVRETLSVVDRAYIIDEGRVLSEGTREFLLNDPVAREIYLGHRFSM